MRVSGWNMDKANATDWLAAEEPLYVTGDAERDEALAQLARRLAHAADEAAGITVTCARSAVFGDAKADTGKGSLALARTAVLDAADAGFHGHMARALKGENPVAVGASWRKLLLHAALDAFVAAAPVPVEDPTKAGPVVAARRNLLMAFGEKSKSKRLRELLPEKVA